MPFLIYRQGVVLNIILGKLQGFLFYPTAMVLAAMRMLVRELLRNLSNKGM